MASYKVFRDSFKENALSGYTELLGDIKYCILFMDEIESERGFRNWICDWVVGERSSLNIVRMRKNLEKLESEIEKGLKISTKLISLIQKSEIIAQTIQLGSQKLNSAEMDTSLVKKPSNNFVEADNGFYNRMSTAVDKLQNTGEFKQKEIKMDALLEGTLKSTAVGAGVGAGAVVTTKIATGVIALKLAPLVPFLTLGTMILATGGVAVAVGAIGSLAYCYGHPEGEKRGVKYQELKFLYDALNDPKLISRFESHHIALTELTKGFEEIITVYEGEVTSIRSLIHEKKDVSSDDTLIEATKMYDTTLQNSLQSLEKSEPGMDREFLKRMATKQAEIACESFLKGRDFPDTKISEIFNKIQK